MRLVSCLTDIEKRRDDGLQLQVRQDNDAQALLTCSGDCDERRRYLDSSYLRTRAQANEIRQCIDLATDPALNLAHRLLQPRTSWRG